MEEFLEDFHIRISDVLEILFLFNMGNL